MERSVLLASAHSTVAQELCLKLCFQKRGLRLDHRLHFSVFDVDPAEFFLHLSFFFFLKHCFSMSSVVSVLLSGAMIIGPVIGYVDQVSSFLSVFCHYMNLNEKRIVFSYKT